MILELDWKLLSKDRNSFRRVSYDLVHNEKAYITQQVGLSPSHAFFKKKSVFPALCSVSHSVISSLQSRLLPLPKMSQIPSWERTWSSAVLLKCLTLFAANSSPTYAVPSLSSVPTGSQGMTSVALKASQLFKCYLIHLDKYPSSASYVHERLEEYKLVLTTNHCAQNADWLTAIGQPQGIISHPNLTKGGHSKNC